MYRKGLNNAMSRFGGADSGDEGSEAGGEVEDSIDQGPWGLAAYAYYWWSGATGQVRLFRICQAMFQPFSLRPIASQDPGPPSWMFGTATN